MSFELAVMMALTILCVGKRNMKWVGRSMYNWKGTGQGLYNYVHKGDIFFTKTFLMKNFISLFLGENSPLE